MNVMRNIKRGMELIEPQLTQEDKQELKSFKKRMKYGLIIQVVIQLCFLIAFLTDNIFIGTMIVGTILAFIFGQWIQEKIFNKELQKIVIKQMRLLNDASMELDFRAEKIKRYEGKI